ncbi:unnamed protein product [Arctia plantaginis]|uniref:Uncharacterized protein n=1 Tax=Arctia plantaginis TaxID=874455 RepID=A0A8S1BBH6_ARCPL|nr:unnamed protein product [Arctia plantaginis]
MRDLQTSLGPCKSILNRWRLGEGRDDTWPGGCDCFRGEPAMPERTGGPGERFLDITPSSNKLRENGGANKPEWSRGNRAPVAALSPPGESAWAPAC